MSFWDDREFENAMMAARQSQPGYRFPGLDEEPTVLSRTLDGLGSLAAKASLRGDAHVTLRPHDVITEELEYLASLALHGSPNCTLSPEDMEGYVAWLTQKAEQGFFLERGWGSLSSDLILTVVHREPPPEEDRGVRCIPCRNVPYSIPPREDAKVLRQDVAEFLSKVALSGVVDPGEFWDLYRRLSVHPDETDEYRKMVHSLNNLVLSTALSTAGKDGKDSFIKRVREYQEEQRMAKTESPVSEFDWFVLRGARETIGIADEGPDGKYAAQVYSFKENLSKEDAERYVREFQEWRGSWKRTIEPLTAADIRKALLKTEKLEKTRLDVHEGAGEFIFVRYLSDSEGYLWQFTWHESDKITVDIVPYAVHRIRSLLQCIDIVENLAKAREAK